MISTCLSLLVVFSLCGTVDCPFFQRFILGYDAWIHNKIQFTAYGRVPSFPHSHMLSNDSRIYLIALISFNWRRPLSSYPVLTGYLLIRAGFLFTVSRCVPSFPHSYVLFGLSCSFLPSLIWCSALLAPPHLHMGCSAVSLVICRFFRLPFGVLPLRSLHNSTWVAMPVSSSFVGCFFW